jgi:sarcosine oxidase gamma subunit
MQNLCVSSRSPLVAAAAVTLGLAALATGAAARDGDDTLLPRGSNQWFVTESLEHSVRGLVLSGEREAVDDASVALQSEARALVTITLANGAVATFSCAMFDDFSHGGTVVKKEVACVR